jgi:hypothetical protein
MIKRMKGIKKSISIGEETYDKYSASVMRTLANQHGIMTWLRVGTIVVSLIF